MKKLREENSKLQRKLSIWREKYKTLQQEQDDYWANKLSLSVTKLSLLFTAGLVVGRFIK